MKLKSMLECVYKYSYNKKKQPTTALGVLKKDKHIIKGDGKYPTMIIAYFLDETTGEYAKRANAKFKKITSE